MLTVKRKGTFIKKFSGPKNEIVCFKFWQAVIASGCPGECAYCFLQNQFPYRSGQYDIKGTLFENLPDIANETRRLLSRPDPLGLILGENQDGLGFEGPYKKTLGTTPLEILMPIFIDENPNSHTLIILSKFTSTQFAEKIGPSKNVVFSWSLSLPSISKKYEKRVASLKSRLTKAMELKRQGFRIRFRLDALAPIKNWQSELKDIVHEINKVSPEMLTIGALRASSKSSLKSAAIRNGRDGSIFDFIGEKDPSNFKHRTESHFHEDSFSTIKELLNPSIKLGLCKEDISVWKKLGLQWQGCHCLSTPDDKIVEPQRQLVDKTFIGTKEKHSPSFACINDKQNGVIKI